MPDLYQGFSLDTHPRRDPSRRATLCVVWARDPEGEPLFGIDLVVTDSYARATLAVDAAGDAQASDLALRWAHGLIDTESWEAGEDATEVLRASDWDPTRNEATTSDDDLTAELLRVFARMGRIAGRVNYAPRFDVSGFADVVGVRPDRVSGLLGEIATRGWIEPYGYGKQVTEGNARITADGYSKLDTLRPEARKTNDLVRISEEIAAYLSGELFRERFPDAWRSWEHANERLAETPIRSGIVGYACREAMQAFAGELVTVHGVEEPAPAEQVTNRVRAVATRDRFGEKAADFFDALINYWSRIYDLTQRQAKNAVREGEDLTEEDARRVVFHTAIVMYELSRLPAP